ncbi:MAG: GNAT family N-acetyltransferase, partial [Aeromonas veronii]
MLRPSRPEDMEEIVEIWLLASLQAHDFVDASCWWQAQEDLRTRYLDRAAIWVFE